MKILFTLLTSLICLSGWAADNEFALDIRDHLFEPAELCVLANHKIKLLVQNHVDTPD